MELRNNLKQMKKKKKFKKTQSKTNMKRETIQYVKDNHS